MLREVGRELQRTLDLSLPGLQMGLCNSVRTGRRAFDLLLCVLIPVLLRLLAQHGPHRLLDFFDRLVLLLPNFGSHQRTIEYVDQPSRRYLSLLGRMDSDYGFSNFFLKKSNFKLFFGKL